MVEKLDQKQTVDMKELLMSEVIQSVALINILDRNDLVSKHELLAEIKHVQAMINKPKE